MARRDFSEFRRHWRPFTACFLGMGSALSLNNFVTSTFAPYLIGEFAWSKAEWALTGMVIILIVLCIPVAGRLSDLFGVRRVAGVGIVAYPLSCLAIAAMNGDIRVYLAIVVVQTVLCCTTTATVYTRLVAEKFATWRGIALAICAGSPAVVAAVGAPAITEFVQAYGWRAGYVVVAAFSALCGAITLALIPPHRRREQDAPEHGGRPPSAYRAIFAMPVFWMMLAGTFLVNIHQTIVLTQLKLVSLAQGVDDTTAAALVSLFAGGVIAGRLISGVALDFLPSHSVAAVFLGLPSIGMLLLASSLDTMPFLALAILLIGLAFGGEGDVMAYLVVRFFGVEVFGTVLGLLTAAISLASGLGAGLLSLSFRFADSFVPFLIFASVGVFAGAIMYQLLGSRRFAPVVAEPA